MRNMKIAMIFVRVKKTITREVVAAVLPYAKMASQPWPKNGTIPNMMGSPACSTLT